ncbi:Trans-1,2-dihydrobenzene-1,2-diol dehydrogenase [Chionoecetes opilio]|uniref:Trans-1,2-dihydrobenzene-1,2-diol dehydrogenase n=1 Tax=Chionoecetes opilio TaxID=41210 RepID=A0A8J4YLP2_CHIOP|nr:Trans-1,2-dihydrobenzene-1,2-diol dehydrogenase [Chionoecetes opilio]
MATPTRWGIVSSGLISSDFVSALKALPDEHRVVAVAARSLQSAKEFAARHGIEKSYDSYSKLATDPDIDVVYIGVLHTKHLEVASEMLRNGKPVLCEKPLCMNVRETQQLVDLARQKKVFLMEAVWARFFPVYKEMVRRIKAGEIGDVVQVIADFGRNSQHCQRLLTKETGGGVTLDIALYPIQLTSLVMGGERPLKVFGGGHLNPHGVDETVTASLVYSGGRVASISASMKVDLPSEAHIIGTKGTIKIPCPMWCPEKLEGPSGNFTKLLPVTGEKFNYDNSQGLMYEAQEVRRCLKEGLLESPGISHAESLTIAGIMQDIRTQVGTVYPQDAQ